LILFKQRKYIIIYNYVDMLTILKESLCSLMSTTESSEEYQEYNCIPTTIAEEPRIMPSSEIFVQFPDITNNNEETINESSLLLNKNNNNKFFKHLVFANQTYFEHFKDAMYYAWLSYKSSVCFFIHAFWPDILQFDGSHTIFKLRDILIEKYNKNIVKNVSAAN
jgi:hypothetical protein